MRNVRLAIVAVLTAVCVGAVTAAAQSSRAPDAIYHGGKIVTVNNNFDIAEAFAVAGDRFVAVGRNATVLAMAGSNTRVVDLQGATVIPGLIDGHDHMWNSAKFEFRGVDVIGVTSLTEMQARLRAAVARAKPGELVFTTLGWNVRPALTRQALDEISPQIPIAAISSRQAKGVYNTAALRRLGISKESPTFKGAKLPVDANGELTGAPPGYPWSLMMIDALLPTLTPAGEDEVITKAMAKRNALGYTGTRELTLWPAGAAALQRMSREGKLTLRIGLGLEFPDQLDTAKHLAALPPINRNDPWLFMDSTGEEPWPPGSASLPDFTAHARAVRRLGWRTAPHVSSDNARGISFDQATDQTLDAYEAVDREQSIKDQRWYMEHVSFATPDEIKRMAQLGIIVSVQDAGYEPPERAPLSPERMAHQNPVRSFMDQGLVVIGGSDYTSPTASEREPNNPMIPFHFYVTRQNHAGQVTTPTEKISREQALRMFTVNPAYATFQEKVKGQIASGMLADFVILNQDLMTVPEEKILATRPLATFVGGRKVFTAPGASY